MFGRETEVEYAAYVESELSDIASKPTPTTPKPGTEKD
jgi:hypothetical protein